MKPKITKEDALKRVYIVKAVCSGKLVKYFSGVIRLPKSMIGTRVTLMEMPASRIRVNPFWNSIKDKG